MFICLHHVLGSTEFSGGKILTAFFSVVSVFPITLAISA